MCLISQPTVVAAVCIHLACKWSNWMIPRSSEGKEWYQYVDPTVTPEMLDALSNEFLDIMDKAPSKLRKKMFTARNTLQQQTNTSNNRQQRPPEQRHRTTDPNAIPASTASSRHEPAAATASASASRHHEPSLSQRPAPTATVTQPDKTWGMVADAKSGDPNALRREAADNKIRRSQTEPNLKNLTHQEYMERKEREKAAISSKQPPRHHLDALAIAAETHRPHDSASSTQRPTQDRLQYPTRSNLEQVRPQLPQPDQQRTHHGTEHHHPDQRTLPDQRSHQDLLVHPDQRPHPDHRLHPDQRAHHASTTKPPHPSQRSHHDPNRPHGASVDPNRPDKHRSSDPSRHGRPEVPPPPPAPSNPASSHSHTDGKKSRERHSQPPPAGHRSSRAPPPPPPPRVKEEQTDSLLEKLSAEMKAGGAILPMPSELTSLPSALPPPDQLLKELTKTVDTEHIKQEVRAPARQTAPIDSRSQSRQTQPSVEGRDRQSHSANKHHAANVPPSSTTDSYIKTEPHSKTEPYVKLEPFIKSEAHVKSELPDPSIPGPPPLVQDTKKTPSIKIALPTHHDSKQASQTHIKIESNDVPSNPPPPPLRNNASATSSSSADVPPPKHAEVKVEKLKIPMNLGQLVQDRAHRHKDKHRDRDSPRKKRDKSREHGEKDRSREHGDRSREGHSDSGEKKDVPKLKIRLNKSPGSPSVHDGKHRSAENAAMSTSYSSPSFSSELRKKEASGRSSSPSLADQIRNDLARKGGESRHNSPSMRRVQSESNTVRASPHTSGTDERSYAAVASEKPLTLKLKVSGSPVASSSSDKHHKHHKDRHGRDKNGSRNKRPYSPHTSSSNLHPAKVARPDQESIANGSDTNTAGENIDILRNSLQQLIDLQAAQLQQSAPQ